MSVATLVQRVRARAGAPAGAVDATRARLALPADAAAPFQLAAPGGALSLSARLRGARPVAAEVVDGLVTYPAAGPDGQTLLHRITDTGTEDYLALDRPPAAGNVVYEVELSPQVAGLRLVEGTLELLDAAGTPRLRVERPYLFDDRGREHLADLTVEGCQVDRSAAPPWSRAVTAPGARRCNLAITWNDRDVAYPAVLDPAWTATGSMTTARAHHTAVTLPNGRVLVSGGTNSTGASALRSAELYDPATGTWAATASMAVARTEHTATLRANGTVLAVGGWTLTSVHRSAEIYNPSTGTWSNLAAPLSARRQHTATLLASGQILIAGGRAGTGTTMLASAETLSTGNGWTATGALPAAQAQHTATRLNDGRVLVVGPTAPAAFLYDPAARTFAAAPAGADARSLHSATLLGDGSVLLAGGAGGFKGCQRFFPSTATWNRVGSLNYAHDDHSALYLSSTGRVLLIGGAGTDSRTAVEIFNPTWETWTPAGPGARILTARSAHTAVVVGAKVLVAGGVRAGTTTGISGAELYDPSGGGFAVSEYKLPATRDSEVNTDLDVELWGSLHRPATLVAGRRYPLLMFLHGNHPTCRQIGTVTDDGNGYTTTGDCGPGYQVVNNHRGYDYIAEELAARGYFVVSVNTNRGINGASGPASDPDLVLARGRLLLRNLEKLSLWSRGLQATPASLGIDLRDRIDLSQVGLMGHSRGGEAVRAAYNEYRRTASPWPGRITSVQFRGIFEIGPVDGHISGQVMNADRTRWAVLLPGCDGDVNPPEGIQPFDRMLRILEPTPEPKAMYQVFGTNHNFYNTEWKQSERINGGCVNHEALYLDRPTGSARQRQLGLFAALSFFTANVGAARDAEANVTFDPRFALRLDSRVHRGFHAGGDATYSLALDDFNDAPGTSHQVSGAVDATIFAPGIPHDAGQRVAYITWSSPSSSTYYQSTWTTGAGIDLRTYENLDFRVERLYGGVNATDSARFGVQLVNGDGSTSSTLRADQYVYLDPPPRGTAALQTVRIPLTHFAGANLAAVRAVRLVFDQPMVDGLWASNIRATRTVAGFTGTATPGSTPPLGVSGTSAAIAAAPPAGTTTVASALRSDGPAPAPAPERITAGNTIRSVKSRGADAVELTLSSRTYFDLRASSLVLTVGGEQTVQSAFPEQTLHTVTFTLPRAAFDRLAPRERLTVSYGKASPVVWDFGTLDKTLLDR